MPRQETGVPRSLAGRPHPPSVGRWRVTRGTGDYADAAGRGRYRVVGEGIGRKNAQGQCSENRPPRVFYVKIRAVGTLSY